MSRSTSSSTRSALLVAARVRWARVRARPWVRPLSAACASAAALGAVSALLRREQLLLLAQQRRLPVPLLPLLLPLRYALQRASV